MINKVLLVTLQRSWVFRKAYGDLLPDGKVKHLEELRQHTENQVAFVGDGMNDAPVLALSNVGIAMGGLRQ